MQLPSIILGTVLRAAGPSSPCHPCCCCCQLKLAFEPHMQALSVCRLTWMYMSFFDVDDFCADTAVCCGIYLLVMTATCNRIIAKVDRHFQIFTVLGYLDTYLGTYKQSIPSQCTPWSAMTRDIDLTNTSLKVYLCIMVAAFAFNHTDWLVLRVTTRSKCCKHYSVMHCHTFFSFTRFNVTCRFWGQSASARQVTSEWGCGTITQTCIPIHWFLPNKQITCVI